MTEQINLHQERHRFEIEKRRGRRGEKRRWRRRGGGSAPRDGES